MPTETTLRTLAVLRDGGNFAWHVIPLFVLVVYVYANEVERGNLRGVLAGLAFLGMDLFNETWNGLVFHFTQFAPLWGVSGQSALVLLVGLNIEIVLGFMLSGIAATKAIPADPSLRIAGLRNRWFFVLLWSAISVGIECVLNALGVLTWEYRYWNASFPYPIFLIGYVPFYAVAYWVYDMKDRGRQLKTVAAILGFDAATMALCGRLGWL